MLRFGTRLARLSQSGTLARPEGIHSSRRADEVGWREAINAAKPAPSPRAMITGRCVVLTAHPVDEFRQALGVVERRQLGLGPLGFAEPEQIRRDDAVTVREGRINSSTTA